MRDRTSSTVSSLPKVAEDQIFCDLLLLGSKDLPDLLQRAAGARPAPPCTRGRIIRHAAASNGRRGNSSAPCRQTSSARRGPAWWLWCGQVRPHRSVGMRQAVPRPIVCSGRMFAFAV